MMVVTGLGSQEVQSKNQLVGLYRLGGSKASQGSLLGGRRRVIVSERRVRTEAEVRCYGPWKPGTLEADKGSKVVSDLEPPESLRES